MDGFAFDGGTLAVLASTTTSEVISKGFEDSMYVTNLVQGVPRLEKLQMRLDAS